MWAGGEVRYGWSLRVATARNAAGGVMAKTLSYLGSSTEGTEIL